MLHWAKAFSVIAVLASFAALWLYPAPLGALAVFMTAVFVTLAILSLITGALGKRRDGWSYSATQALATVTIMAGAAMLLAAWLDQGRGTREAGRTEIASSLVSHP